MIFKNYVNTKPEKNQHPTEERVYAMLYIKSIKRVYCYGHTPYNYKPNGVKTTNHGD